MIKSTKKFIAVITLVVMLLSLSLANVSAAAPTSGSSIVKNAIFLIPDGMSVNATTIARYLLSGNEDGSEKLFMDQFVTGLVTTTWAKGPITDSAPAGTAYATGHKSLNGVLGIDPDKTPKATLLEAAQLKGKAVGLVATSEFMHATPAAFSAHEEKRSNYAVIAEQMLNQDIDVLLGTGASKVKPEELNIIETAKAKGYEIVNNKAEMEKSKAAKLWGNFSNAFNSTDNLSYDIDRKASEEPSLAEMTAKAIDVLSKDKDGFFLMVEGSKIDWAAHANDTIGIVTDTLAFDKAFKTAVDFAKKDGNTIVVAVTDHGNSGISIGSYDLLGYDSAPFSILTPLKGATKTAEGAMALLKEDKSNVDEVLKAYGINPAGYTPADITSKDRDTYNNAKVNRLITIFKTEPTSSNLIKIMNQKAYIGYTTGGHTGEDVPVYLYTPEKVSKAPLMGVNENTDVCIFVASSLGLSLEEATKKLFVDVTERKGASISGNVLTLNENGKTLTIKANQSTAKLDNKTVDLNGEVAVYINGRFYVPQSALDLLKK